MKASNFSLSPSSSAVARLSSARLGEQTDESATQHPLFGSRDVLELSDASSGGW